MAIEKPIRGLARSGALPFSPQGWPFMLPLAVVALVCLVLGWLCVAGVLILLLAFVVNFFHDPERDVPQDPDAFVSPADGKVVRAEQGEAGTRVDIFMNVFNVHVNRAPMAGRITEMRYFPGKFINASLDKASEENERNRFEMELDAGGRIAFTQIAGLVARRIVAYVGLGDAVKTGQRVGMIRFGSRVDCEMPAGFVLKVAVGQKVKAGETVLAVWEESNG